jgi:hypothetical protein
MAGVRELPVGNLVTDDCYSLGDVINNLRRTLDLEPVSALDGPNLASALKVPHTYCWSPSLIPKPLDWPSHIGD